MPDLANDRQLQDRICNIVKSTNTQDAIILIQNLHRDENTGRVISIVSETLYKLIPTQSIDITRSLEPTNLATSRTLIIYIYACQSKLGHEAWRKMVSDLFSVWHSFHVPRVLLLLVEEDVDAQIEEFLKYLWSRKILDVAILEILPSERQDQQFKLVAHQYNPFTKNHVEKWNPENTFDWYPNKVKNMHGEPLYVHEITGDKINAMVSLSLSIYRGISLLLIKDLMNFTVTVTTNKSEADVFLFEYNYITEIDQNTDYDGILYDSKVCLVIPTLPTKTISLWNFIGMIVFGISVVLLFLLVSQFLVTDSRLKQPMYVMNLLLGFSVTRSPTTLPEKILFLCLAAASSRYTSMFYTELFDLALVDQEIKINNFDDLAKSGLIVMVDKYFYPEIMNMTEVPTNVKSILRPMQSMLVLQSLLVTTTPPANTSYFFELDSGHLITSRRLKSSGKPILKLTTLCLPIKYVLYTVQKRSPYKEELHHSFLRLSSSGYMDYVQKNMSESEALGSEKLRRNSNVTTSTIKIPFPFLLLFFGHGISLIVFLGEILVHKLRRKRNLDYRRGY